MTVADVFFTIGRSHRVCEDYGLAGSVEVADPAARRFAFVADGCSSAQDSDFGARLLCRAAAQQFGAHAGSMLRPDAVIWKAVGWRESLGLPATATDATLLGALEDNNGDALAVLYGDGVVAGLRRDGSYDYWQVECARNAPSYLSYLTDNSRLAAFRAETGGKRTVTRRLDGEITVTEDALWGDPEGLQEPGIVLHFDRATYQAVAVMSDGVESFRRMEGTSPAAVPLTAVLDQLMEFSTLTPGFVQRQMNWFFRKFTPKKGWWPEDDVSVAALALDLPEETP
jgi:hypothetical protein